MTKKGSQQLLPLNASTERPRRSSGAPGNIASKTDPNLSKLKELFHPAVPTEVFVTYWVFAARRQQLFFDRFNGLPWPWTKDEVLATHRFTNAYRAADRVSQYLIRHVQYDREWSPSDLFFRTILFKFFNRIDTWKRLVAECGEPQWSNFSSERLGQVLDAALAGGARIYSAAYIMPSGGPKSKFRRKHRMHLHLIEKMMKDGLPAKIAEAKSMEAAFELLLGYPTIGDFLAYQYVTDLNYSKLTKFDENDFAVAGPGAREGIEKCFRELGGKDFLWIIRRVQEVQDEAFKALGLSFRDLWGRSLHLIDCQNLFCEVAKYARVHHPEFNTPSGRTRIKQKFVENTEPIEYLFPPKWEIVVPKPNRTKNVAPI
jgi:hypothetical protein